MSFRSLAPSPACQSLRMPHPRRCSLRALPTQTVSHEHIVLYTSILVQYSYCTHAHHLSKGPQGWDRGCLHSQAHQCYAKRVVPLGSLPASGRRGWKASSSLAKHTHKQYIYTYTYTQTYWKLCQ